MQTAFERFALIRRLLWPLSPYFAVRDSFSDIERLWNSETLFRRREEMGDFVLRFS